MSATLVPRNAVTLDCYNGQCGFSAAYHCSAAVYL